VPDGPTLFAPDELALRPTGQARLRKLARLHGRSSTERERRRAEDQRMMQQLQEWAGELCRQFRLRCRALEPEREGVTEYYGICYEDGVIRIRLRHARTGRLLKESSLADTLCHELAHLRHLDHSPRFKRLYLRILDVARDRGYYRPGRVVGERTEQLSLFDDGLCGTDAPGAAARRGTDVAPRSDANAVRRTRNARPV
jgi:hypothetical protein